MVGEFLLRERLDEGGFGTVYRCEQALLGRQAVVKVMHRRLRRNDLMLQRFMREAQLASRLDHPYAAHVYAFGIEHDDGLFWIAMEMVQGIALDRWVRDRGPLSLEQFVPFFERVAEVVQTAHERGIVHRDLKPSNVMVIERAGRLLPKLLDFGIAKLLDADGDDAALLALPVGLPTPSAGRSGEVTESPGRSVEEIRPQNVARLTGSVTPLLRHRQATTAPPSQRLTRPDATLGSPPYMSPEQWSNAGSVGLASDLYALGVVAYEALTGRRPFNAETHVEYIELHRSAPVPPLGDGFPSALDRLFQRALAKQPEDRWGSALEFAAALRVASGLGGGATDLPRLDEAVRGAWLADAPQPLAESIVAFDAARNASEARDLAQALVRNLLRYLLAVALATHAQVREDGDDPALLELVRAMRRRDLREDERVQLLRLLVRPLTGRRGAHPIPELVDLVTPHTDDGADGLDPILALYSTGDHVGIGELVRVWLVRLVPEVTQLLRKTAFVLDYVLVVSHEGAAERWTGWRRPRRALVPVSAGTLVEGHPMLLGREGRVCVDLWPVVQAASPTEGAEPELFLFDGHGRHGARLTAAPAGFVHHDPRVWEWVAAYVLADPETTPDAGRGEHSPYLGLSSFSTDDAERFVGREREADAFLNRLRQRPLQVVVGSSGAGKSSFVHAGVIPGLPQGWRTVTLRPGGAPLSALAARLPVANVTAAELRPLLEDSPAAVAALVARAASNGTIVVVIDQLEELFTLCANPDERVQFAAVIAQLAASADAPIRVICAIRDDFLMHLEALAPLRSLLSPALVLLGNPSRDALVRIVEEPARRTGYVLSDPALAYDMVNVVVDRPGALALLSFTASWLWELRDRRFRQLTRNAYDAMGGVGGALGRHAEATLDTMSPHEQGLVRAVFRHLVTADGTRAVITCQELVQRLGAPRADAVIDKLVAARLITVSEGETESHVEVIHEALISAWPRLQRWVREDVDGARMRDQIRTAARQWHDRGRPHGLLWRDGVFADLERWLRRLGAGALSELETAFVEASRRDARRAVRIRRGLVALILGILLAAFQYRAALQSRVERQLTTQSYLEQGRTALLDGKHAEALSYLAEVDSRGGDSPTVAFMLARAVQPFQRQVARFSSSSGRMWSAVFSPDGQQIVTTDDRTARVWDAQTHQLVFTLPHGDTVYHASFSPDGTRLVTAGHGFVKIWNLRTGSLVRSLTQNRLDGQDASYHMAVMSPDGRVIAAIDGYGTLTYVWDADTGTLLAELPNTPGGAGLPSLAFNQGGDWLATCGGGDDLQVFDTHTWGVATTITRRQIGSFSFDPSSARLATATATGDVSIWALPSGTRDVRLQDVGSKINHIAFSPDGAYVVTASEDETEQVWNAKAGKLHVELKNHRSAVRWAEFDPTSKLVVSAGVDGKVVISDVATGVAVSVLEGPRRVSLSAHFDPTSHRVVAASWDGTARVWDATPTYRRWSSSPIDEDCGSDGSKDEDQRFIAISCTTHGSYVWDTAQERLVAQLPSVTRLPGEFWPALPVVSAAGDRVAIANGSTVVIYALPDGHPMLTIMHPAVVNAVAFSRIGHDLVSASIDGSLLITRDKGESYPLPKFRGGIDAVAFVPDGRVVAASSRGGLRVYDPHSGRILADLGLSEDIHVRSFQVSADSRRLITIARSGNAAPPELWDLEHYRRIRSLDTRNGQVLSAHFVRGDREILTAGDDGAVDLWDGMTGALRQTRFGTSLYIRDAALTPDGLMLVTAGGDGWLRFWSVTSGRLIWTLHAHQSAISGIHFEGTDIVTRSSTGEISRWSLARLDAVRRFDRIIRCLPLRFDEATGGLVDQQQMACDIPADQASR